MTLGVGGSSPEQALAGLRDMSGGVESIGLDEYRARVAGLQSTLKCGSNCGSCIPSLRKLAQAVPVSQPA